MTNRKEQSMDEGTIETVTPAQVFATLARWKAEREAEGLTVDRTCWPWFAYAGNRFDPDDWWCFGAERPGEWP
jgi:hypothetical protein